MPGYVKSTRGGLWMPDTAVLSSDFQRWDDNDEALKGMIDNSNQVIVNIISGAQSITPPNGSWGFYRNVYDPYQALYDVTFNRNVSGGFYTIGPTGSDANIIYTELDSIPADAKAIKLNLSAAAYLSNLAEENYCFLAVGKLSSSPGSPSTPAVSVVATLEYEKKSADNTIDVDLENRKFKVHWHFTQPHDITTLYASLRLQGYWK